MAEKPKILLKKIEDLLEVGDKEQLRTLLEEGHASDIAEIVEILHPNDVQVVLNCLDKTEAAEVFSKVDEATRSELFEVFDDEELIELISELDPDVAADVLSELDNSKEAEQIKELMVYPEDSAGGIMDPVVVSVTEGALVNEAIERIRQAEVDEDFYSVFVVDKGGRFLGDVRIRLLITSRSGTHIRDLIDTDTIFVTVDTDQQEVFNLFKKHESRTVFLRSPKKKPPKTCSPWPVPMPRNWRRFQLLTPPACE
jgi:magnesium transporter